MKNWKHLVSKQKFEEVSRSKQKFEDLTQTLKFSEKKTKPKSIIITGDLNFSTTDWKQMSSPDELDNTWLNYFVDENFQQMLNFTDLLGYKKQLDVFLTNEPQFENRNQN